MYGVWQLFLQFGSQVSENVFLEDPDHYEGPQAVRKFFSDPMITHVITRTPGRGAEEVKTNDVTGRVRQGEVGFGIEVGRPCSGATMEQIQKITKVLAANGVVFEDRNPLTHLMSDRITGTILLSNTLVAKYYLRNFDYCQRRDRRGPGYSAPTRHQTAFY